jgi:hypothetical protein
MNSQGVRPLMVLSLRRRSQAATDVVAGFHIFSHVGYFIVTAHTRGQPDPRPGLADHRP